MGNFIGDYFENRGWLGLVTRNSTTGALEAGGTAITGISSFTWAGKPDASEVAIRTIINIPASEFPHTSCPLTGLFFMSDGVNWIPVWEQVLAKEWGADGIGVATIAAGSATEQAFTLPGGVPTLLAGMAYDGMTITQKAYFKNVDGNGSATFSGRFGTAKTIADGVWAYSTATAAADRDSWIQQDGEVISTTQMLTSSLTSFNSSGATNAHYNKTINFGSAYSHGFTITGNPASASDNLMLLGYTIKISQ